jgi:hypothetical protein
MRRTTRQEEAPVAIVIVNEIVGGNQDFYDQVNPKVMPDGKLPDGCKVHVAGPVDNGWRVIGVWDSEEQFEQFRDEKLIPAIREVGAEERIAPSIEASPVYKLITA